MSQVWFITGSARGLGRDLTETVLAAGHRVVATARRPEQLDDLVTRYGDHIHPLRLDVTDLDAAERAIAETVKVFGGLDVVVNNAGYADVASVEDVTLPDFRAQIDTNLYGVVHVTKAALPVLREQGSGHIIQIASVGGRIGTPGLAAYQTAKWAVEGFSEVLAREVEPLGLKVTVIEPGGLRTDWAGASMSTPPVSQAYQGTVGAVASMLAEHNGSQTGDPAKAAKVILDLTELPDPPLRLLLGSDAVQVAAGSSKARDEEDAKWRHLSESIDFG